MALACLGASFVLRDVQGGGRCTHSQQHRVYKHQSLAAFFRFSCLTNLHPTPSTTMSAKYSGLPDIVSITEQARAHLIGFRSRRVRDSR